MINMCKKSKYAFIIKIKLKVHEVFEKAKQLQIEHHIYLDDAIDHYKIITSLIKDIQTIESYQIYFDTFYDDFSKFLTTFNIILNYKYTLIHIMTYIFIMNL